jgi:hypothetical protein
MTEEPKPKLIIDEDWKTQVQREKETLKKETSASQPEGAASTAAGQSSQPAAGSAGQLPPATFPLLVTMLSTQALAALGLLHDPSQGAPQPDHELAKHSIDLLAMLEEKTKGNLSTEESSLLAQTLHELRMLFVRLKTH